MLTLHGERRRGAYRDDRLIPCAYVIVVECHIAISTDETLTHKHEQTHIHMIRISIA